MEYYSENLYDFIDKHGACDYEKFKSIFVDILTGFSFF